MHSDDHPALHEILHSEVNHVDCLGHAGSLLEEGRLREGRKAGRHREGRKEGRYGEGKEEGWKLGRHREERKTGIGKGRKKGRYREGKEGRRA